MKQKGSECYVKSEWKILTGPNRTENKFCSKLSKKNNMKVVEK
jgi:hypothetical protein